MLGRDGNDSLDDGDSCELLEESARDSVGDSAGANVDTVFLAAVSMAMPSSAVSPPFLKVPERNEVNEVHW